MMVEMMVEEMIEEMVEMMAAAIQKTPPTPHHLDSSVSQSAGTQR